MSENNNNNNYMTENNNNNNNKQVSWLESVLIVPDAKGSIREIILPKGLDLDRPKRTRTSFTAEQLYRLEMEFQRCQYVVGRERTELARQLSLSETQVPHIYVFGLWPCVDTYIVTHRMSRSEPGLCGGSVRLLLCFCDWFLSVTCVQNRARIGSFHLVGAVDVWTFTHIQQHLRVNFIFIVTPTATLGTLGGRRSTRFPRPLCLNAYLYCFSSEAPRRPAGAAIQALPFSFASLD